MTIDARQTADLESGAVVGDDVWMDSEIAQLNERLSSLEAEFAIQAEVAAVERASYATKEDIARIEAILLNAASKDGIARIDASLLVANASIARIDATLAAVKSDMARMDASLTETRTDVALMRDSLAAIRIDIARMDAVLDSIQKNYATKADLLHLEARMQEGMMQTLTGMAQMEAHMAQMETHMAQMETRMAQMETRIVRWMLATFIAVIGVSSTVVFGVVKLLP